MRCPNCGHDLVHPRPPAPPPIPPLPETCEGDERLADVIEILHKVVKRELKAIRLPGTSDETFQTILERKGLSEGQFIALVESDIMRRPELYPKELGYFLAGELSLLCSQEMDDVASRILWFYAPRPNLDLSRMPRPEQDEDDAG